MKIRKDILNRGSDIRGWIRLNKSKSFISKQLKCAPATLNNYLSKLGITYSGNQCKRGYLGEETGKYKDVRSYLYEGSSITSYRLKVKLINSGLKKNRCERCGLSTWRGVDLSLELHHKDGNKANNTLSNLEILCPNCHSITPNYRSKNRK